jgi:hypothetical protein
VPVVIAVLVAALVLWLAWRPRRVSGTELPEDEAHLLRQFFHDKARMERVIAAQLAKFPRENREQAVRRAIEQGMR